MPTHSSLLFAESPDGLGQDVIISSNANMPGPGSSTTPHSPTLGKAVIQTKDGSLVSCMFCDEIFSQQAELGPHVLSQHPTTLFEPSVLRVDAEFRVTEHKERPILSIQPIDKEEVFSCILCGQVSQDASELENHLRKHKDYFTYCCNVCGRRFREPWFLKNHMKMHGSKAGGKKAQHDQEITINGAVQGQNTQPVVTLYKMCMVCGFFFPDHASLAEHSKGHYREVEPGRDNTVVNQGDGTESPIEQDTFLGSIKLRPRSVVENVQPERSSKWIPQLDPFNTYQAWQLATKGKIAVGPNNTKELGLDAITDNEDSDKEELSHIWTESQADKSMKEGLGKELRSQQQVVVETPSPEPDHGSLVQKDKARPTNCEECGRHFRTYHQLVLHSRVHKKERGGESPSAPTDGKLSKAGSLDHTEEGLEDGSEEAAVSEAVGSGEFGSKGRSRLCSYCAKTFRSNYYLTIHLRTHTGEKPFKCVYCNYAAAQKTSLKLCLSSRFGNLPQMDLGGPSNKRLKYCLPQGREADAMEKHDFRVPTVDGANGLLGLGRSTKTSSQSSSPAVVSDPSGPVRSPPVGRGSMDTDWNIINILRSYNPADLATLYHGNPPLPSHGGLANSRAGSRTALFQHLPSLPHLQRLEHPASFPGERYGTADKSL
ncbi:hypothetical protein NHX12_013004 [Muraenolepis orangiensis]|uniref:C2H2-type domain-containing protein n=1 Tax=Muraenolepis orangiensis TaxID=630683 RepID=A0A9Q0DFI8_9TELE|nr:hypothetical protein NHX12_013004 [Muraenolepis orangiensis]